MFLAFGAVAFALDCDEIANMVRVSVPEGIVLETMQAAGVGNDEGLADCLAAKGMSAAVVAAARAPGPGPTPAAGPKSPAFADVQVDPSRLAELDRIDAAGFPHTALARAQAMAEEPEGLGAAMLFLAREERRFGARWRLREVARRHPGLSPAEARNAVAYAGAVAAWEDDRLVDALRLAQLVSEKDPNYARARFLEGVIHTQRGELRSGVRAFATLAKDPATPPQLRAQGLLGIARIYCSIGRYEEAIRYYGMIEPDAHFARVVRREWAWALFLRGGSGAPQTVIGDGLGEPPVTKLDSEPSPPPPEDHPDPEQVYVDAVALFARRWPPALADFLPAARAFYAENDPAAEAICVGGVHREAVLPLLAAVRDYHQLQVVRAPFPAWLLDTLAADRDLIDADTVAIALVDEQRRLSAVVAGTAPESSLTREEAAALLPYANPAEASARSQRRMRELARWECARLKDIAQNYAVLLQEVASFEDAAQAIPR